MEGMIFRANGAIMKKKSVLPNILDYKAVN